MSSSATPALRSSDNSTAAPDASGSKTTPAGSTPARCTHFSTFVTNDVPAVTTCVSTSSRAARHADRIGDAVLPIDGEFARQRVDDLPVGRHVDDGARVDDAFDVEPRDLALVTAHGDDAVRVLRAHVFAGHADVRRGDAHARHALGGFDGGFDRLDGLFEVGDDAFAQSKRRRDAEADDIHRAFAACARDDDRRLRRADVETGDDVVTRQEMSSSSPQDRCGCAQARADCAHGMWITSPYNAVRRPEGRRTRRLENAFQAENEFPLLFALFFIADIALSAPRCCARRHIRRHPAARSVCGSRRTARLCARGRRDRRTRRADLHL